MRYARFWVVVVLLFSLLGCTSSESLNQRSAKSYQRMVNQMEMFGVVEHDSELALRVQRVFTRLHPIAEKSNQSGSAFDWQITVLRNPKEAGAWTMPGGKMVIYTGLIEVLKLSDDELALILAHEMAHVVKEHGKHQVNISRASYALGLFGSVAASSLVNYAGSAVVLAPEYAVNKPYSRNNELEADRLGLLIMAEGGYNPNAAKALWTKMYEFSGDNNGFLRQLASTHPAYAEREANLAEVLPQALDIYRHTQQATTD
ncbi:M48 family metallopeptidase [Testudinibacter aquarius]|uniref:M48 family metallopeptidase n=1 Tax=Testudinibacter aquarius TaxID=1524974 RepID=A0A4R3XZM4_9PAST|nr:M48 family metallopeptidase [Testudinibacter aquarius]KAE9528255.1 hypothetical protein A1D24_10455 [Testudinibacter aquarius]TCV84836.1 putative metalloprotease [Testudinibacter aquarius]TNG92362.1 M48 family metallopeptidase [Testudinibacter aquarius]